MLNKENLKLILGAFGPSAREAAVRDVIASLLRDLDLQLDVDALGNLIALKKGVSADPKKVMLAAHMDQIGLIVMDIDDNGFLRVAPVGGVNPAVTIAREVMFESGLRGVTHFETEKIQAKDADIKHIFIDIGAKTKFEAEAKVQLGDMAVYASSFVELGDRFACGALDNRVSCAVLVDVMRALSETSTENDIYAVFTVQEEVGLRGAGAATYAIEPDFAINVDVTTCGDTPKSSRMSVSLGSGAAIKVFDRSVVVPACVKQFLVETAVENGILYQLEVLTAGGTDTAAIQRTKTGVLAGCVSIPTRYIHTPVETADYSDCEAAIQLVLAAATKTNLPKW